MSTRTHVRTVPLHVLVVDDSAVVRQVLGSIFEAAAGIEVQVAADPLIALRKMSGRKPDVIVLDIEMPRMDGLTFLRKVMAECPTPVIICAAGAERGSDKALRALDEGAVEIVTKPMLGLEQFLNKFGPDLLETVREVANARVGLRRARGRSAPARAAAPQREPKPPAPSSSAGVIAIGASTGGPQALQEILGELAADSPPVLVVQHMPREFTGSFAARLDQECKIEVREARDGDALLPGLALVAPGDSHLLLLRTGVRFSVELSRAPKVQRHRPSVDVLFQSVAVAAGARAMGILLTGMGYDGARGLEQLRRAGATTIAQSEETACVFGMPARAIAIGAAERVLHLEEIPAAMDPRLVAPTTARSRSIGARAPRGDSAWRRSES